MERLINDDNQEYNCYYNIYIYTHIVIEVMYVAYKNKMHPSNRGTNRQRFVGPVDKLKEIAHQYRVLFH